MKKLTAKPQRVKDMTDNPALMRLSKSKIGSFSGWCAYSFGLDNLLNIKGSSAMWTTLGVEAHELVEAYYIGLAKCKTEDEMFEFAENYEVAPKILKDMHEDANTHLEVVIALDMKRMQSLKDGDYDLLEYGRPVSVEEYMRVERDGTTQNKDISGMIDMVFRETDGGIGIYDLKTGKVKSIKDHYFQLHLYKWMYEQIHPGEEVTVLGIIWSANGTVETVKPNKRSLNAAIKKIQTTRDRLQEAWDNRTEDNPLAGFKKALRNPFPCSFCPMEHKSICWKEEYDVDLEVTE